MLAPSIFLLTGTGLSAFNSALDDNKLYDPLGSLAALGALLLAGVLYGILVMARLSPLGPGLAGLASWGVSGWALFDIEAYGEFFSQLDVHMVGAVGESGLGIMLGIPLVATLFSGRRWRRSELYSPLMTRSPADPAWLLPASPVYQSTPLPEFPLPDVPPPSLRYPASTAFPAPPLYAPPAPESADALPYPEPELASRPSWRTPPYIPPVPDQPVSSPPAALLASEAPASARPVSAPPELAPPVAAPAASTPQATQPVLAPPAQAEPTVTLPGDTQPVSAPPASAVSGPSASVPPVSAPPVAAPGEAAQGVRPFSGPPELAQQLSALDEISWALRPVSGPPAEITMAQGEAPPLPRRVPTPPPGSADVTVPIVSPPPPPHNEVTERLGPPGSIAPQAKQATNGNNDETVHLRPE
ncbi:MAG TPA: hypothetical protein VFC19_10545 [Candidatus Limnocylindrales bacterium]|nr:hypothetical protein [Candidatus Limnocylindrales bacterium]